MRKRKIITIVDTRSGSIYNLHNVGSFEKMKAYLSTYPHNLKHIPMRQLVKDLKAGMLRTIPVTLQIKEPGGGAATTQIQLTIKMNWL